MQKGTHNVKKKPNNLNKGIGVGGGAFLRFSETVDKARKANGKG